MKGKFKTYVDGGIVPQTDPPKKEESTDKSDYNWMMNNVIKQKGGSADVYEGLMNKIAYHETGAEQRMRPDAIQITMTNDIPTKNGVGRGLFQYEMGVDKRAFTAINRTFNEYEKAGQKPPKWLVDLRNSGDTDFSKLSADQQKTIFLADYLQKEGINLADYANGKITDRELWFKHHQAGGEGVRAEKEKAWDRSMKAYYKEFPQEEKKTEPLQQTDNSQEDGSNKKSTLLKFVSMSDRNKQL